MAFPQLPAYDSAALGSEGVQRQDLEDEALEASELI
jgi:hypothetical protein